MDELPYRSPCGDAPVYYVAETDTTMADARARVAAGAPSGLVVVTDFQRAGRGRLAERTWESPRGAGLLFTIALADVPTPGSFSLRCGLAVAKAIESLYGVSAQIKWPNDLLVSERKLCGVLCEHASPWTYAGFGVNLRQTHFSPELAATATSLRLLGVADPDRDVLLQSILTHLGASAENWRDELRSRLWRCGATVEVRQDDGSITAGTLTGIDDDGFLLLESDGATARVLSGELLV